MKATEEQKRRFKGYYRKRWADPVQRERILAENLAWQKAHPESNRKNSLAWRNRNKQKAKEAERRWRKSPAGRKWTQARDHARRAAKLAATVNPRSIVIFIASVRSKKSLPCYYCQLPTPGKTAHIDHIIPLSKGGAHSVENLCAACPRCNQTKLNKPIHEWMKLGQQILSL